MKELTLRGVKIAVLSNKYQLGTEKLINHFFPEIPFVVIFGQRTDVPIKPSPVSVFQILDACGVDKKDVLYVGDSAVDMRTGYAAQVDTVGVTWGFRSKKELEDENPEYLVDAPKDILSLV